MVRAMCDLIIVDDPAEIARGGSPAGKPFLRLRFHEGPERQIVDVDITLNLAEMIGGAARGAQGGFDAYRGGPRRSG
jgi:hypothetical protein